MAPLIVMIVAWVLFRLAGAIGVLDVAASWTGALRLALAVMFTFTASAHFAPITRMDMVRMVPPWKPKPKAHVTNTGELDFQGAIGLLVPVLLQASAYGLIALLIALFPKHPCSQKRFDDCRPAGDTAYDSSTPSALLDRCVVVGRTQ
jgi:hypothetical protein